MKSLLVLILLSTAMASANTDAFDPNSCSGPVMSAARALELLKDKFSVNLAGSPSDPDASIIGTGRQRQKINGLEGQWFPYSGRLYPVKAYLKNNDGEMSLAIYYGDFGSAKPGSWHNQMSCHLNANQTEFNCEITYASNSQNILGSGSLKATMTDSCLRLTSEKSTPGTDTQWAFLLNF